MKRLTGNRQLELGCIEGQAGRVLGWLVEKEVGLEWSSF